MFSNSTQITNLPSSHMSSYVSSSTNFGGSFLTAGALSLGGLGGATSRFTDTGEPAPLGALGGGCFEELAVDSAFSFFIKSSTLNRISSAPISASGPNCSPGKVIVKNLSTAVKSKTKNCFRGKKLDTVFPQFSAPVRF